MSRVRAANPGALFACDPVMGDRAGGLFVKPDVPPIFAEQLLPVADLTFPNAFELEYLTGGRTDTLESALAAADRLRATMRAGACVIVTSLLRADGPADRIEVLASQEGGAWLIDAPLHRAPPHGAGDCFAALILGHYLKSGSIPSALACAVSAIHGVLAASVGEAELQLIAAQDHFDPPAPLFRPAKIR